MVDLCVVCVLCACANEQKVKMKNMEFDVRCFEGQIVVCRFNVQPSDVLCRAALLFSNKYQSKIYGRRELKKGLI